MADGEILRGDGAQSHVTGSQYSLMHTAPSAERERDDDFFTMNSDASPESRIAQAMEADGLRALAASIDPELQNTTTIPRENITMDGQQDGDLLQAGNAIQQLKRAAATARREDVHMAEGEPTRSNDSDDAPAFYGESASVASIVPEENGGLALGEDSSRAGRENTPWALGEDTPMANDDVVILGGMRLRAPMTEADGSIVGGERPVRSRRDMPYSPATETRRFSE